MTNEELDKARATEARRLGNYDIVQAATRLAREGWTPPVAVDPDLAEAKYIRIYGPSDETAAILAAIKRGRALAAAEAKPGMVWKKWDGSSECPVALLNLVVVKYRNSQIVSGEARNREWPNVTHYCEITQPEEK